MHLSVTLVYNKSFLIENHLKHLHIGSIKYSLSCERNSSMITIRLSATKSRRVPLLKAYIIPKHLNKFCFGKHLPVHYWFICPQPTHCQGQWYGSNRRKSRLVPSISHAPYNGRNLHSPLLINCWHNMHSQYNRIVDFWPLPDSK